MPPNPPRNAQRLRRARDMSSTCAWRPLLVLHNFPVFSLLLSIMPDKTVSSLCDNDSELVSEKGVIIENPKLNVYQSHNNTIT